MHLENKQTAEKNVTVHCLYFKVTQILIQAVKFETYDDPGDGL